MSDWVEIYRFLVGFIYLLFPFLVLRKLDKIVAALERMPFAKNDEPAPATVPVRTAHPTARLRPGNYFCVDKRGAVLGPLGKDKMEDLLRRHDLALDSPLRDTDARDWGTVADYAST